MIYTENALNILAATSYKGIGKAWVVKNIQSNEPPELIVSRLRKRLLDHASLTIEDFDARKDQIKLDLHHLEEYADGIVGLGDVYFPVHRGIVKNSEQPVALFYRGDISLLKLQNRNIAVIGLLNPDQQIESIEREVVAQLVRNGATIVSGLALGCDSIAHVQALDSGGKTVAILPSSLDDISPKENTQLANNIVDNGGLLMTEYGTSAKSHRELIGRYQERDRLQALFSDCVVLSASYTKNDQGNDSGARLAMGYALGYRISRAVIYDANVHANDPQYDLNRQVIAESDDVVVINRKNMEESIHKIKHCISVGSENQSSQLDLFD